MDIKMACIKERKGQNVIILSTNFLWPHRPQKAPEHALLGGMPMKIIGNSFVTFYTKHLPLEFIGNYDVCETPRKSIGKSFNIQSNYYLRRIFPKRITGESF